MSILSPVLLLAAVFLYAASSASMPAIAHDPIDVDGHGSAQSMQQRHMTSLGMAAAMPFAAHAESAFQQMELGRNLLNNLERQKPRAQPQQPNAKGNKDNDDDGDAAAAAAAAADDDDENDDDKDFVALPPSSSVVEDWSLVCKQLCGASLGGVPCAAECTIDENRTDNSKQSPSVGDRVANAESGTLVHQIFEQRRSAICIDLCEAGLGGSKCHCSTDAFMPNNRISPEKSFDLVCNSFCEHAGTTVKGCSTCKEPPSLFDVTAAGASAAEAASMADGSQNARAIATFAGTGDSTAPNWDTLCASLCKTGDGGSLCNCDLSPFFK